MYKKFEKKNAQSAVEFLLILMFVLAIVAGIMFLTGSMLTDIKDQEINDKATDFVENINNEIAILNNVEYGYLREMEVNTNDYDINITENMIILKDILNGNKTYYFELRGNFEVNVVEKYDEYSDLNITYIRFEKEKIVDNSDNIILDESQYFSTFRDSTSNLVISLINHAGVSGCTEGGIDYGTELFRIAALSDSHVEISGQINYNYSICLNHTAGITLGNTCLGPINNRLFYLGNVTNSPVWKDNATAAEPSPGYYDWQEVCVNADGGNIDIRYGGTRPTTDHICIGSFLDDDENGGHFADCNRNSPYKSIWLKIEE